MSERSSLSSGVFLALALALCLGQAHAAQFSSLEERMSAAQFRAAGLDKLSPEELAKLNQWLRDRWAPGSAASAADPDFNAPTGGTAAPARSDRNGFSGPETPRTTINDRIIGTFRGWSGSTIFRLENGQVWQQIEADSWSVESEAPRVEIRPKLMGSWMLSIEGYNRSVRVKRIE